MNNYVILTDSSADLDQKMVADLELEVLPLTFLVEEKSYRDFPDGREMNPRDFYQKVRDGAMPTTNAVNVGQATDALEPLLKAGMDVLFLAFSSGLSTTYNSIKIAGEELAEKYPERKVYVVDTLCASLGQGLLVYHAAQRRKAGESIEQVRDWVEENKLHLCHWFTVNDLMHLKRGGRVSAATALVGTMLSIKPVLHVDNDGHLINVSKARGRKSSLDALADKVGELGIEPEKQVMFLSHSDCLEDAQYVADRIKAKYGTQKFYFNYIGPVIGSHTGVGCVALFFIGKER